MQAHTPQKPKSDNRPHTGPQVVSGARPQPAQPRDAVTHLQQAAAAPIEAAFAWMPNTFREFFSSPLMMWPFYSNQGNITPLFTMQREWMRMADQFACNLYQAQDVAQSLLNNDFNRQAVCDVKENRYEFRVELPGITAEDVKVSILPGSITIEASTEQERRQRGREASLFSRVASQFQRVFPLPIDADIAHAEARIADERLTVTVPRMPGLSKGPREIPVDEADGGKGEARHRKAS